MNKRTLLISVIAVLNGALGLSATENIEFSHLTTADGMSSNTVITMYRDERGFLWFGTRNGLNLYNGNRFVHYKYDEDDENGIQANGIQYLCGNGQGQIYCKTSQSLVRYDIDRDSFTPIRSSSIDAAACDDRLYFASRDSIYSYTEEQGVAFLCLVPEGNRALSMTVRSGRFYIGTENDGLYIVEKDKSTAHPLDGCKVNHILIEDENTLWLSSGTEGLFLLKDGKVQNFRYDRNDSHTLCSDDVRCSILDMEGQLWIGTRMGLNRYDRESGRFERIQANNMDDGLSYNSIHCMMTDAQGNVWLGTYYGGVNYFNQSKKVYNRYSPEKIRKAGFNNTVINDICGDDNVLYMNIGNQLAKYSVRTRNLSVLKEFNDIVDNIYYDRKNKKIWISIRNNGLLCLDPETMHSESFKPAQKSISSLVFKDIDKYKEYFVVGTSSGIYVLDTSTRRYSCLLEREQNIDNVNGIFIDSSERMWIHGSRNGIYTYDLSGLELGAENKFEPSRFRNYSKAGSNEINSNTIEYIFEDSNEHIWLCTNDNGIDCYDMQKDSFEYFNRHNSYIASNTTFSGCELRDGKFLFTTDAGYSILDTKSGKINNYNKKNGFPLTQICEHSIYRTEDGEIFIGSVGDGLVSFFEQDIKDDLPADFNIIPFSLNVNGKAIKANDGSGILSRNISNTSRIDLKSGFNSLNVEYAITNYNKLISTDLEYKLENFNDKWTAVSSNLAPFVSYTNLSPGKYCLVVRSADNPSIESRLDILVHPPFYNSTWAWCLYFVFAAGIIWLLIHTYKRHVRLTESVKYEQQRAQEMENMNQSKIRFFSNISHEFRTPLTLIIGQTELLLQNNSTSREVHNKLLGIYNTCLQFKMLISELLDFRKAENGELKIKVREQDLVSFTENVYNAYLPLAEQKKIKLEFSSGQDEILLWFDGKQIQKVINNLLSNAFKFTPSGGKISVLVYSYNDEAIIEVRDNGAGIEAEDIDKIFMRFYQADSDLNTAGTGIGLALSKSIVELHHGSIGVESIPKVKTKFTVKLKLGKLHFSEKEFADIDKGNGHAEYMSDVQKELLTRSVTEIRHRDDDGGEKPLLLIVDDSLEMQNMLSEILSPFYRILTADNGGGGLELARSEKPDIIVSDVLMPVMSGVEMCNTLKHDDETCNIPIVLLTALSDDSQMLSGLKSGADEYITKPFKADLLITRCNNLVNSRLKMQEIFGMKSPAVSNVLTENASDARFINKVMALVEKNMGNPGFTIDNLVNEMYMSRTRLYSKIKELTGMTPHDFISDLRLKKAAAMLTDKPALNIAEISDSLGFGSPRNFSKLFKAKYGLTPAEYRKSR